jgi:asparagine synthase (glutamine-hydrolysing)
MAREASSRLHHRGPDFEGAHAIGAIALAHTRLAIVDPESGPQPLVDEAGAVTANGEIYNHAALRERFAGESYPFRSTCDCEVLLPACEAWGADAPTRLRGVFAFVWADSSAAQRWVAARDPIGVMPLYYAEDDEGWWFASERKALPEIDLVEFPAGHVLGDGLRVPRRYFSPAWIAAPPAVPTLPASAPLRLRAALERAIDRRMMADVEFGTLLSGGLDSSVVAALAQRVRRARGLPPLKSFAIGLDGGRSPDLEAARRVAEHIGTDHREITYTLDEGVAAIPEAVFAVETDDVTTVRASTPMLLLARAVRAAGCKMVFSGEGADEALCGYLYWHHAPSPEEGLEESRRRVLALGRYDCQRANLSTMAAGVEARVPFLDGGVLEVAMTCGATKLPRRSDASADPGAPIEKALLREACVDLLPPEILWRQKEQFGDGVGYAWIDRLREEAGRRGFDSEAEWYASELRARLPSAVGRIDAWTPKWVGSADPSGRSAPAHRMPAHAKKI